jgi:hypothetical protein
MLALIFDHKIKFAVAGIKLIQPLLDGHIGASSSWASLSVAPNPPVVS